MENEKGDIKEGKEPVMGGLLGHVKELEMKQYQSYFNHRREPDQIAA
jgi:hypothetical protein